MNIVARKQRVTMTLWRLVKALADFRVAAIVYDYEVGSSLLLRSKYFRGAEKRSQSRRNVLRVVSDMCNSAPALAPE